MKNLVLFLILICLSGNTYSQNINDSIVYDVDKVIPSFVRLSGQNSIKYSKQRIVQDKVLEAKTILTDVLPLGKNVSVLLHESNSVISDDHVSFTQYYKGIKVEGSQYHVHYKDDVAESINGNFRTITATDVVPGISERTALANALAYVGAESYMWENEENEAWLKKEQQDSTATFYPKGELVIYFSDSIPILTYKFNIYANKPLSRNYVYVNADDGKVEGKNSLIYQVAGSASTRYSGVRNIETQSASGGFRLHDYSRGSGIKTYNLSGRSNYADIDYVDNDNNWTATEWHNANNDDAALDAHWGAEMTYDYFKKIFNRNSYDNRGSVLLNYVNATLTNFGYNNNNNAFWDGQRMTYGVGTTWDAVTSLDVIAHEISHGITSSTANLVYQNESGALNEGFSDIWAACVENYAKSGSGNNIWRIGEDIMSGALRYMDNPKMGGQPDTYQGANWHTANTDHGGVHTNSGVLNHWFYLLSVGGSGTNDLGNSYAIQGIGIDKAAKIAYNTLTKYLTSNSNYSQACNYSIMAATSLYGVDSEEVIQVTDAWYAVGVGSGFPFKILGTNNICPRQKIVEYRIPKSGSGFVWQVSGKVKILSGQGTNKIQVEMLQERELAEISVTCGNKSTSKKIFLGIPVVTYVNGPARVRVGERVVYSVTPVTETAELFNPYKWTVSPNATKYAYKNSCEVTFPNSGNYLVMCQGDSPCGNQNTGGSLTVTAFSGYYLVSSLASKKVELSLVENLDEKMLLQRSSLVSYELYSKGTGILKSKGQMNREGDVLDFSNLPKGVYVIKIQLSQNEYETHSLTL
ncbi:M4 family metallopeptidase [Parabacteroides sp. GYB001]|uniref:M4 family metallopeptidase n=1 Tax=Parabacteroides leei TaxID=2939491 RepID=UPI002016AF38|nr:M4 family metallopeptidase [Parabacteroides leei]MCL3853310.1 M4 family metallopeptidase [Parabacteroides leei]